MFHPHRSFSGALSSPNSTDMSEGAEPDAKATEVAASPSSAAKADDEEWVPVAGEDTPLVGRKIEVVVKDEHEKADVTTTAVTDEGVPPKNFLQVIQDVAKKTGDETVKLGKTVGQKTKELTDHVGRETVKIQDNLKPHVDKIGENTDREIKKHQESARVLGETIGRSTRELTATVGAQSVKIATNVGSTTREVAEHVGKESGKIADAVGKESVKIADAVGKETKKHYDKVAPVVEPHAKKYSSLINGTMADLMTTDEDRWWKQTLDGTARAYGRVVLCDNPFTGLMISLAILFGSPVAWIVSLYCAALTNLTAKVIGLDQSMMRRGIFASNAILVGTGLVSYLTYDGVWGYLSLVLVATFAAPVTLMAYLFVARILSPMGIPILLFPYVGVMMFALFGASYWKAAMPAPVEIIDSPHYRFMESTFKGIAQIFVVDSCFSGFLVFLGMLACSRILAAAAFVGSALAALLSFGFFGVPVELINAGFLGYNSALAIPALVYFLVPTKKLLISCVLGLFMTLGAQVALEALFATWSIPVMVLPFCFAMLPFVALDMTSITGAEEPFVTLIPLAELSTPEEHIRRYKGSTDAGGYEEVPDIDEESPLVKPIDDEAVATENGATDVVFEQVLQQKMESKSKPSWMFEQGESSADSG